MLLTPDLCLKYCETPAATADLQVGRALEQRHALHIDGQKVKVTAFLTEKKPSLLASPEAFDTMLQVQYAATKPIFSGVNNILGKALSAQGRNFYYQFRRPELAVQFDEFLKEKKRTGQNVFNTFRSLWFRAMLLGFQGVLLVDLPAVPTATPQPFFTLIPSANIHDIELTGDKVEYLILKQDAGEGKVKYFCYDDSGCHKVLWVQGSYNYLGEEFAPHELGYVPACPVTTRKVDPLRPRLRTSPVDDALEVADVHLQDANWCQLGKAYHANPQKWSKGVRCDYVPPLTPQQQLDGCMVSACNAGSVSFWDGSNNIVSKCPRCAGQGRYIPVGPDKVYIVEQATSKDDPEVLPVAGYIVPDLTSLEFLSKECEKNEGKIEKAILGKEGILAMQTKQDTLGGKLLDLGPVADRLTTISEDGEFVFTFLTETMARFQYGEDFEQSAVTLGRGYLLKSAGQLEADYAAAKEAGLDDALLYSYLEDIIYTKWAGDPMELERNLLKLELTPVPTQTVDEAAAAGVLSRKTLLLKSNINDYFNRFERENGSILDFASLLSHGEKVNRILQQFNIYLDADAEQPAFKGGGQGAESGAGLYPNGGQPAIAA